MKSTVCSSRDPESNSQQLHGGPQPSVMHTISSSDVSKDSYTVLIYIKLINISLKKVFDALAKNPCSSPSIHMVVI